MKIVFLDIDGVLIPYKQTSFNSYAIQYLNEILAVTNAKLVISSNWGKEKTLIDLQNIFKNYNLRSPCIIDKIFKLNETLGKAEAINRYLEEHIDIDQFVVIDDEQISVKNLIRVRFDDGLTIEARDEIIRRLNNENSDFYS